LVVSYYNAYIKHMPTASCSPKTIIMVFVASPISTQSALFRERIKTG
jgi:hypothetical protein